MDSRVRWLDDFVKWFFNASPVWVDERKILRGPADANLSLLTVRPAPIPSRRDESPLAWQRKGSR